MTSECLLDVYYRQEESVMALQNALPRQPRSDGFAYTCGLIRASWRIQRPAEERTTGTEEVWIVATREMSDAAVVVSSRFSIACLGKIGEP